MIDIQKNEYGPITTKAAMPIETVCRDCIFATWNDNKEQTGCRFDKIRKYKQWGVEVKPEVEGDRTFYAINALCTTSRSVTWNKYNKDAPIDILQALARKEVQLPVDCIVMCEDDEDIKKLERTVKCALNQTMPFKRIFVGVPTETPSEYIIFCIEKIGTQCEWEVVQINNSALEEDKPLYFAQIDQVVIKSQSVYYAIFEAGGTIDPRFVEAIDNAINDRLHRFLAIRPLNEPLHGLVVQGNVSNLMGNFGYLGVLQKLEERLENEIFDGELTEDLRCQLITTHKTIMSYLSPAS